jgi:hypothetical protein
VKPFQVGDYVKRLVPDMLWQKLTKDGIYMVIRCWSQYSSGTPFYSVGLDGFNPREKWWDADKFELVQPKYVQACPCGIHWLECPSHNRDVL